MSKKEEMLDILNYSHLSPIGRKIYNIYDKNGFRTYSLDIFKEVCFTLAIEMNVIKENVIEYIFEDNSKVCLNKDKFKLSI